MGTAVSEGKAWRALLLLCSCFAVVKLLGCLFLFSCCDAFVRIVFVLFQHCNAMHLLPDALSAVTMM